MDFDEVGMYEQNGVGYFYLRRILETKRRK
jgi:hypothetical protein